MYCAHTVLAGRVRGRSLISGAEPSESPISNPLPGSPKSFGGARHFEAATVFRHPMSAEFRTCPPNSVGRSNCDRAFLKSVRSCKTLLSTTLVFSGCHLCFLNFYIHLAEFLENPATSSQWPPVVQVNLHRPPHCHPPANCQAFSC